MALGSVGRGTVLPNESAYPIPIGECGILSGRVDRDGDALTLALAGELDLASSDAFAALLLDIEAARPPTILVDLAGLTFLGSSGLRELVRAHRRAGAIRLFAVRPGSGPARRALEVSGLTEHLAADGDR